MRWLIFILIVFCGGVAFAQTTNEDAVLASQYYENEEFEKAAVLYEKLYNANPEAIAYYQGWLNTLLALQDYRSAEKLVKKQAKNNPDNLIYSVHLGFIYQKEGKTGKAKSVYEEAIGNLTGNQHQTITLATAFSGINALDLAILTYERGESLLNRPNFFAFEIAALLRKKGETAKMIERLLNLLDQQPRQLQGVQNYLQSSLSGQEEYNELASQLYKRIQKKPEYIIYPELLIWHFMQVNDLESAFLQIKALDKRYKEKGQRVYDFAQIAALQEHYDIAEKAYQYVLEKGKISYLYLPASRELLNTKKAKAIQLNDQEALLSLRQDYESFINEFGNNATTAPAIVELANLHAFHLHNLDEAIEILEELLAKPGLQPLLQGQVKLEVGDYYLLKGDVWEATIFYSQVDKTFKDAPLGEEARYKNAKLAYYRGDFEWAQAQLDVLKSATSELVANDALHLSIFIMDNMGLDTTAAPMEMFARADLLLYQNKEQAAWQVLDSLNRLFSFHALADDVAFMRAKIKLKQKEYEEAAGYLQNIKEHYSDGILADDALFALAKLHEDELKDTQKAMELYQELILKFKDSMYSVEARKRFRALRGDLTQ